MIVLGSLYFLIENGFNIWILFLLLFGIVMFMISAGDMLKLTDQQIKELDARRLNLRSHAQLMDIQSKIFDHNYNMITEKR